MPKARTTCTRCSMRRQRCDREVPCKRCVAAGVASSCSRTWRDGYDPSIHRRYPKPKTGHSPLPAQNLGSQAENPEPVSTSPDEPVINDAQSSGTSARSLEIHRLQDLLPNTTNIFQLVQYYEDKICWLYWSFSAPLFRRDLTQALQPIGSVQLSTLDLRWAALLFAVLSTSMTCCDEATARFWGYSKSEKNEMGRKWVDASVSCLHLSQFMAKPHLSSIQTVLVLSNSAHLHGRSNELFTLYGVAIRIAQSLGLQRLSYDEALDSFDGLTEAKKDITRKRELGRRVWAQLQVHDRFCVFMTDMYLIQECHSRAILPRNIDDESLTIVPDSTPHFASWASWLFEMSRLIAQYHDAMSTDDDEETKYRNLLLFDSRIRGLNLSPTLRTSNEDWCRHARQEETIVRANKIESIHRRFLGRSFVDPRYTYSRWTSIDAARSLIREVEAAVDSESTRPAFGMIRQAHMVGACITLCLDLFHRSETDPDAQEDRGFLDRALVLLNRQKDSVLASQGSHLISSLLKDGPARMSQKRTSSAEGKAPNWPLECNGSIESICQKTTRDHIAQTEISSRAESIMAPVSAGNGEQNLSTFDAHDDIFTHQSWIDMMADSFPPESGLDNITLLEDLFR